MVFILKPTIIIGTIAFFCGSMGLIVFSMINFKGIKFTKVTILLTFPMFMFFVSSLLISQSRYIEYSFFDDIVSLNTLDGYMDVKANNLYGANMDFSKYETIRFKFVGETGIINNISFYLSTDSLTQYEIDVYNNNMPNEKFTTILSINNRKFNVI